MKAGLMHATLTAICMCRAAQAPTLPSSPAAAKMVAECGAHAASPAGQPRSKVMTACIKALLSQPCQLGYGSPWERRCHAYWLGVTL